MLATHFNVTIFPWPKSDLNRSDVYSMAADSGKTKAALKALLLPHDFVSESQHRGVKSLLPPQSHVDDRVFDELIGGNLREKYTYISIRANILIVKHFIYRFLVNVPSQICRRESGLRAAIQIETLPQTVSEVKLVNSLRPDHLIINSNSNCLRTNTFGSSERDPGSPP